MAHTGASIGMPDIHSGYGFAIGNIAAVDMADPQAVVSPGGVGFDINCGVSQGALGREPRVGGCVPTRGLSLAPAVFASLSSMQAQCTPSANIHCCCRQP